MSTSEIIAPTSPRPTTRPYVIHRCFRKKYNKSVIGLGFFDGVHKGHQKIIEEVKKISESKNIESSIFTFSSPIRKLFNKEFYGEITPLEYKLKIFEKLGVDICYVLEFNEEISKLSKEEFICKILDNLNIDDIVCGSDYRFGYKASGDIYFLKEKYNVHVVDFINSNGSKISSSTIINLIRDGEIGLVNLLLGRLYFIESKVVKGLGNGSKIGFPTANINSNGFVLPKNGVYKVEVEIGNEKYDGICNVGIHPTISKLDEPIVEVLIKDFKEDIYSKNIKVNFVSFIRDEIKFNDTKELAKQISIDLTK